MNQISSYVFFLILNFFRLTHGSVFETFIFKPGVHNSSPMAGQKKFNVQGQNLLRFYTYNGCFHEKKAN
jgi:hypothetical protein